VTDPDQWQSAVQAAELSFGPVSVLVNSAGIVKFLKMVEHCDDDFRRVVDVAPLGIRVNSVHPGTTRSPVPACRRSDRRRLLGC
jgi:3alpha(or 20beta)-hydroxysteroid dehydrogenase